MSARGQPDDDHGELPPVGSAIAGKYRLDRLLGTGGMGAVFEALNTWTTRRVAIKVLRRDLARQKGAVARFLQEARSATHVAHPNIVEVLDMGEDPALGMLYLVQELLSGRDLRDALHSGGPMRVSAALDVVVPVMGALVAAAKRGIVHRDIKPENIFLARTAGGPVTPKLIDFGVSKILHRAPGDPHHTVAGSILGTPNYMSPEQARGDLDIDGRADVWAIGVVLYECISGRCPFDDATPNLVMARVLRDDPTPLDEVAPQVSQDLSQVVRRALCKDRDARFPTMQAMLAALLDAAPIAADERQQTWRDRHAGSLRAFEGSDEAPALPGEAADPLGERDGATLDSARTIPQRELRIDGGTLASQVTESPARAQRRRWSLAIGATILVLGAAGATRYAMRASLSSQRAPAAHAATGPASPAPPSFMTNASPSATTAQRQARLDASTTVPSAAMPVASSAGAATHASGSAAPTTPAARRPPRGTDHRDPTRHAPPLTVIARERYQ